MHTKDKTKDAYIDMIKAQIDELNASMHKLEAKASEAREDARVKYREEMDKLVHQSKLAGAKLAERRAATGDAWQAMVAELGKLRDAFTHPFNYFKSPV